MDVQRRAGSVHWLHPADEWRGNLLNHSGRPHMSVQRILFGRVGHADPSMFRLASHTTPAAA
jgi:hypothetical protein